MGYSIKVDDDYLAHHGVEGMKWGVWNDETKRKYGLTSRKGDKLRDKADKAANLAKAERLRSKASAEDAKHDKQVAKYAGWVRKYAAPFGETAHKNAQNAEAVAKKYPEVVALQEKAAAAVEEYTKVLTNPKSPEGSIRKAEDRMFDAMDAVENHPQSARYQSELEYSQNAKQPGAMARANLAAASQQYAAVTSPKEVASMWLGNIKVKDKAAFEQRVINIMNNSITEAKLISRDGEAAVDALIDEAFGHDYRMYRY